MTQITSFSSFPLLLSQIITNTVASNDKNLLAYISGGQKPKMGVTGVKSKYRAVFLMEPQGEGPLSFSDFDSLPFSFARTLVITLD